MGAEISPMNTVTALTKGGYAMADGTLRVGDVIVAVDGISVVGKKAISAMDEKAERYRMTVMRDKAEAERSPPPALAAAPTQPGARGTAAPDMEGWLTKVKSLDGKMLKTPEKRWVVLQVCWRAP